MCGASGEQKQLASEQAAFYKQATAQATQTFGEQQNILGQMQSVYEPILAKGPNQQGFSDEQTEQMNAQAVEGTAQNYKGASKAVNEALASRGGGDISLTSGGEAQLREELASSSAATESGEESAIQQADWAQGSNEFAQATSALSDVSGQYNPVGFENAATGAGSAANTTMNDIASENTAAFSAVTGAINGAAGAICPAKGSLILMEDDSYKSIENINTGDFLMGIDGEPQKVLEIQSVVSPILRIVTDQGHIGRSSYVHALAAPTGGFITITKSLGKKIVTNRGFAIVTSLSFDGMDTVYNMMTDGNHTYQADGIWALGVGDGERQITTEEWNAICFKLKAAENDNG